MIKICFSSSVNVSLFNVKIHKMKNHLFSVCTHFFIVAVFFWNIQSAMSQQLPDHNFCDVKARTAYDDSICIVDAPTPFEIKYDDGTHEEMLSWVAAGGESAVRFTAPFYPFTVTGGQINVGDGTFPEGADYLGTDFKIYIYDDDGQDGLPGTLLDSATVVVNRYEWIKFGGLTAEIDSGDFYIAMKQLYDWQHSAPLGVDTQIPVVYRSYIKQPGSNNWMVSTYNDLMIRALICGIHYKEKELKPKSTGSTWYQIARVSGFDPENGQTPEDGTLTVLDSLLMPHYTDTAFYRLPAGYYAYAYRIFYEDNDTTLWYYSNVIKRSPLFVVNEDDNTHTVTVYPNPADNSLTIMANTKITVVTVVDLNGQTVVQKEIDKAKFSVNTSRLQDGLYFIKFTTGKEVISRKILIKH